MTILVGGEDHTEWVTTYPFNSLFERARRFPGTRSPEAMSRSATTFGSGTARRSLRRTIGDGAVIAGESWWRRMSNRTRSWEVTRPVTSGTHFQRNDCRSA